MSPRSKTPLVAWTLFWVYGCFASLGYGLHELAGMHHHGVCDSSVGTQRCGCDDCPFQHAGEESQRAASSQDGRPAFAAVASVCEDCAICSLLSLARVIDARQESVVVVWAAPQEPPVSERAEPLRLAAQHPARGPPAAA